MLADPCDMLGVLFEKLGGAGFCRAKVEEENPRSRAELTTDLTHCEACGTLKLAHNLCPSCFSQISRRWKKEAREGADK